MTSVRELADRMHRRWLEENPFTAAMYGIPGYDDLVPDESEEGQRTWRAVHWLAYAAWPMSVLHSLTAGSDAFAPWMLAIVAACFGIILSAWRWQQVLRLFDAHVPLPTLTRHYFAGQFVSNVMPSTVGGDVVRIARCAKNVGSTTVSFGSVVLERTNFEAHPGETMLTLFHRDGAEHRVTALLTIGADGPRIGQNTRSRGMGRILHPADDLEEKAPPDGLLIDELLGVLHR